MDGQTDATGNHFTSSACQPSKNSNRGNGPEKVLYRGSSSNLLALRNTTGKCRKMLGIATFCHTNFPLKYVGNSWKFQKMPGLEFCSISVLAIPENPSLLEKARNSQDFPAF
jgi:hypothetical protein